jgi:hypothetical protein
MSATVTNGMMRIRWKEEEKAVVCQWILDHLRNFDLDVEIDQKTEQGVQDPHEWATDLIFNIPNETLLPPLRAAISLILPGDRWRRITRISQTPWLRPRLIHLLETRLHSPAPAPTAPEKPPTAPPPPPPPLPPEPCHGDLVRLVRRQGRSLRRMERDLKALADLVLEVLTQTPQTPQTPQTTAPSPCPIPPPAPLVAIVGVRRHQEDLLRRRLQGIAVLEFMTANRCPPEALLGYDHVYCVQYTARDWKRRARHILGAKFTECNGTSRIIESIERLAGVSV